MPSMVESSCATERSAILIRFRYIFLFDSLCEIISYANTDSILAHIYKRSLVSAHMVMRYENKIKRPPLKRCIPSGSIAHTRYIFDTYLCIRCDSMAILKIYSGFYAFLCNFFLLLLVCLSEYGIEIQMAERKEEQKTCFYYIFQLLLLLTTMMMMIAKLIFQGLFFFPPLHISFSLRRSHINSNAMSFEFTVVPIQQRKCKH